MKKDLYKESNFVLEFFHRNVSGFNQKEMIMTTVQATIQALATIESLSNDIDTLFVLDRQQKSLAAQVKTLKDNIANTYGETSKDANDKQIPHRGEKYGVTVVIANVKGTVDYDALIKHFGITEAQLDSFRKEGSARITVTPTA